MKKLICPECGENFIRVSVKMSTGKVLVSEQCANCGGVMFDDWHGVYRKEELQPVGRVDLDNFKKPYLSKLTARRCPKHEKKMRTLKNTELPHHFIAERCDVCGILWLNYVKTKVRIKKFKVIAWVQQRMRTYREPTPEYLFSKLLEFTSRPTFDYFNYLPVSDDDEYTNFTPEPGTVTALSALFNELFNYSAEHKFKKFPERVIQPR